MRLKDARHYLEYLAAIVTIKVITCCPRGLFFFLAPGVSRLLWHVPQFGSVALMNVAAAFPEKKPEEHRRIALKSIENLFLTLCEFFWTKGKKGIVQELVVSTPEADATAAAAHAHEKEGVIFVSPHHGNWEFAGMTLALIYHFKVGTVVRTPRNPYLDKLISSGRMVEGVRIIHSRGAVLGMKHALDDGYTIGTLIDQNTRVRDGGVFVNFFGMPVPVSRAPAGMARRHGYFVATGAVVRDGRKFKTLFKTLPKPTSEYESDEEMTQDLMSIAEEFIRAYPEQYLWMYKRFQYIPRGADEALIKRFPPYAAPAGETFYNMKAHLEKRRRNAAKKESV